MQEELAKSKILIINGRNSIKGGNDFVAFEQYKLLGKFCKVQLFTAIPKHVFLTNYFFSLINILRLINVLRKESFTHIFVHSYAGALSNSILVILKFSKAVKFHFIHDYKLICPVSSMYRYSNSDNEFINCDACAISSRPSLILKFRCNRQNLIFSLVNYVDFKINRFLVSRDVFDKFIFVSQFTKNKICTHWPSIEDKSIVLYNTIEDIGINVLIPKVYDFVFVGRISIEKGIFQICKYLKSVQFKGKILIIGEGPMKDKIDSAEFPFVHCVGFKNGDEKINLMRSAKFMIFPSLWLENNPIVLIEAMCIGLPVLANKIGGVPEIISNGFNGYVYDSENDIKSIIKILDSLTFEEYNVLSSNSRKTYENKFLPENLYNTVIAYAKQNY